MPIFKFQLKIYEFAFLINRDLTSEFIAWWGCSENNVQWGALSEVSEAFHLFGEELPGINRS
jgi:hypothetical protein